MEIEENGNSCWENGSFQRYLLRTEKICNLKELSDIAAIGNRDLEIKSGDDDWYRYSTAAGEAGPLE
jgi:hypothetical protein